MNPPAGSLDDLVRKISEQRQTAATIATFDLPITTDSAMLLDQRKLSMSGVNYWVTQHADHQNKFPFPSDSIEERAVKINHLMASQQLQQFAHQAQSSSTGVSPCATSVGSKRNSDVSTTSGGQKTSVDTPRPSIAPPPPSSTVVTPPAVHVLNDEGEEMSVLSRKISSRSVDAHLSSNAAPISNICLTSAQNGRQFSCTVQMALHDGDEIHVIMSGTGQMVSAKVSVVASPASPSVDLGVTTDPILASPPMPTSNSLSALGLAIAINGQRQAAAANANLQHQQQQQQLPTTAHSLSSVLAAKLLQQQLLNCPPTTTTGMLPGFAHASLDNMATQNPNLLYPPVGAASSVVGVGLQPKRSLQEIPTTSSATLLSQLYAQRRASAAAILQVNSAGRAATNSGTFVHANTSALLAQLQQQQQLHHLDEQGGAYGKETDDDSDGDRSSEQSRGLSREQLEEMAQFAREFKLKRMKLGLTQAQVTNALQLVDGPAYSQSAICRFENLDMTPKSVIKIRPVLQRWMQMVDEQLRMGLLTPGSTPNTALLSNERQVLHDAHNDISSGQPTLAALLSAVGSGHLLAEDAETGLSQSSSVSLIEPPTTLEQANALMVANAAFNAAFAQQQAKMDATTSSLASLLDTRQCALHLGVNALSHQSALEMGKKRKRRTSFTPQALDVLNAFFELNTHPSGAEMTTLAERLNYDREVVRVWFCNKRQALKNTIKKIKIGDEHIMV